jgi:hypothetical protein
LALRLPEPWRYALVSLGVDPYGASFDWLRLFNPEK